MKTAQPLIVNLCQREVKDGRISFYLDIRRFGKRSKVSLNLFLEPGSSRAIRQKNEQTTLIAMKARDEKERELQDAMNGVQQRGTGYGDSFVEFFKDVAASHANGHTARVYDCALSHVIKYNRGNDNILFSDVTRQWVIGFKYYLENDAMVLREMENPKRLSMNSANSIYAKFCCVLNEAVKSGLIYTSPALGVHQPKPEESKREFLTKEELEKLINTPCRNEVMKRTFLFSCMTGLRYGDVTGLKWLNIENRDGRLYVAVRMDKVARMVYVPINSFASSLLPERGADDEIVFVGIQESNRGTNRALATWCKDAGITKHITFHCSRHTFATQLLTKGVELYTTSKLLGHKNVATTQIYGKIVDELKQEAVDKLDEIMK